MSRRVLIVSPSFPPINAADMQRVRMSLPHYREHGWEPIVLAVEPKLHGGVREDALLSTIPSDIRVHRCGALPRRWTSRLGLRNVGLRAWWHLLFVGARLIKQEKIDLVFFSTTQFATFSLGRIWKTWLGAPYAIDLQDPWFTDHYRGEKKKDRPGGWKYTVAHLQARILEGWSLRRASALMSVSSRYIDDLRLRHSWFKSIPTDTIVFGTSESDLDAAKKISPAVHHSSSNTRRLLYTGVVGPVMAPALRVLFDAFAAFKAEDPATAELIRFEFLGTSYAPKSKGTPSVLPIARSAGVENSVHEQTDRLGHLEALRAQSHADALLLLGTSDPAYSASKLYPYCVSGRPILAVIPAGSTLENILRELSCATVVAFDPDGSSAQTKNALSDFFRAMISGFPDDARPHVDMELFRREYLAPALTARQCALFDKAISVP